MSATYETIIGLEIHVQLATKSKMFCACDNRGEDAPPNTTVCPVCTGHPGTLPVVNDAAVKLGVRAGLALNCTINPNSRFDRKSYFYPDLPKGYQISQFDQPLCMGGHLLVETAEGERLVHLTRAHLEEDAAKLHRTDGEVLIDFNRAGTPLLEIVTEPDIRTPDEAKAFAEEIQRIMRWIKVSSADMEKGHLRIDANISLRPVSTLPIAAESVAQLYPKTEIKNINSFMALKKALLFEIDRQTKLWEAGEPPTRQTTRGWDERKGETVLQRDKEESADYRYFPEPDLPPLNLSAEEINEIREALPELPQAMRQRFQEQYAFTAPDAWQIVDNPKVAQFTEEVISEFKAWIEAEKQEDHEATWHTHKAEIAKLIANWLVNRFLPMRKGGELLPQQVTAENFAEFTMLLFDKKINATTAQHLLEVMVATKKDPSDILRDEGLQQVSDASAIDPMVDAALAANPDEVARYRAGKTTLLKFFVGKVMAEAKGKANPKVVEERVMEKLR